MAERAEFSADHIILESGQQPSPPSSDNQEARLSIGGNANVLICFSHLRWHFVYQRPQHLMTRFARRMRVFFFEEPVLDDGIEPRLELHQPVPGLTVAVPHLPHGLTPEEEIVAQRRLLDRMCAEHRIVRPVLWYYTPMSGPFSEHLEAARTVYDCMDELAAFRGAPPAMLKRERRLFERADLVFTGGYSLYEAKRRQHGNVHAFPSSVDVAHFGKARAHLPEPPDQAAIPHPRIGHYAVLDERLDRDLVAAIADARPDWQLVLVGPVVKIDPAELPRRPNIHYLGTKRYEELPAYLSGWDVAFMPFAMNESTRFISPTKTPEYLAAGKPVVSTPITDVVRTYGERGLVKIAATPEEFIAALAATLQENEARDAWLEEVDGLLGEMSWDATWARMKELIG